jgi:hypothetical protein
MASGIAIGYVNRTFIHETRSSIDAASQVRCTLITTWTMADCHKESTSEPTSFTAEAP